MAGIGEVMFGKALVLSLWAAGVGWWKRYKKRRRAGGLQTRLDKKTGVYVVYDPIERIERWVRIALWVFIPPTVLYALFVLYVFLSVA